MATNTTSVTSVTSVSSAQVKFEKIDTDKEKKDIIVLYTINETTYLAASFEDFLRKYDPFPHDPKEFTLNIKSQNNVKAVRGKKDIIVLVKSNDTTYVDISYEDILIKYNPMKVDKEAMIYIDVEAWKEALNASGLS